ncbi:1,4-dihydroxy-2-naphthoate polyprenyltransferase [Tsukamurella pseudospumae]|uniref:1,4-dihydroxy-2-naphthoate octaprenyltransferase n=1 Tax=Tsukamurella pseudospumae TaxID=239498 RepID=A0A138A187_9ACTN|nr:1,4-dihydroxy-2-naphthoate polyprenyltransferase [Tsukamurella pseudospumae]KXP04179.1 1,4-dihydroxy-2-naphthoate octaprenyltransferase [Tsukamurella pseudospumae]
MATPAQWLEGARPRTLPNAIAPVIAGTGAAGFLGGAVWWKALLALVVSLALIIGVNFANDYSDGVRGTDDDRVGPLRLVGSGLASPAAVKRAAFLCFGVGAVAGIALSLASAWWLILVGAVCVAGAWFYTGGSRPYGYLGFGEIAVFVFFGLVAVLGTQFVQAGRVDGAGWLAACAVGAYSSAVLVANNLRDIPTDRESGKITLAVRLGDSRTRVLFAVLVGAPTVLGLVLALVCTPWALLTLLSAPLAVRAALPVVRGGQGRDLIPGIAQTGLAMLVWSVAAAVGLFLGA